MLRVLLFAVGFGLSLYALIDCIRTEDNRVKSLPKIAWILLIVLVTYLGPIAWIVAGRDRQWPTLPEERRPIAPDDDPDFLRNLEIDLKRRDQDDS